MNKGTQADKKDYKKPDMMAAAALNDEFENKFTVLEDIVETIKKVTIP